MLNGPSLSDDLAGECSAYDPVRNVDSTTTFVQSMFYVGVVTSVVLLVDVAAFVVSCFFTPVSRTAGNHESFIGDTDEHREYLCEYGFGGYG